MVTGLEHESVSFSKMSLYAVVLQVPLLGLRGPTLSWDADCFPGLPTQQQ